MLTSVTLNPCVDYALFVENFLAGDTNRVQRVEIDAGGKGVNVSRIYAALGGKTTATGFLGGSPGPFIRQILEAENVLNGFVTVAGETRTNFSIEDAGGTPPTTLNQKGPAISASEWEALRVKVAELALDSAWVALGGSLPPGVPNDAFFVLGESAISAGRKLILDADGMALVEGLKLMPHMIKPNAAEAARLLGKEIETDTQAVDAARKLYEMIGGGERFALLSRGKDGAVLGCSSGTFLGRSPNVVPKSTVGAGDSMIGGFLWAIESGQTPEEALKWGLAAGAATATTDGTGIGRKSVIELLVDDAQVSQLG